MCRSGLNSQHGAALMLVLSAMVLGMTALLAGTLSLSALKNARQEKTSLALAQAKEALIAYAVSSENVNGGATPARPGNFPCPDTDAPGTAGYGDANELCSAGAIGRLPWKTLGLPELVDELGEPLWYAQSGNFRKTASVVNSDTKGSLQVYDRDGSTLLTPAGSEAVAIVFAAGATVGNQQRNSAAQKTNASNYLDSANGRNNATLNGPFIAADNSDSFNDRLLVIRTRDFMPIIEKRIARELKTMLENYRAENGVYPYPAPFSTCKSLSTCNSNTNLCRGRLPFTALPVDWGGSYALPSAAGGSSWFSANLWYRVIYYSAGTGRLASSPPGCNGSLNVSGNSTAALFFMPGTPLGNVTRSYANNTLAWYLDDAENQNMDDNYVTPTATANDQLYALP
jgi:hypothetical protein